MKRLSLYCLLAFMGIFCSCEEFPRDTYGTLKQVEQGTLLVGYTENPPWVYSTPSRLDGIEVRLVEEFAASLGAEVEWVKMNEQALLEALEWRNLQLVVSGLTNDSPWSRKVSFTRPYLKFETRKHVIAVPKGEHHFLYRLEDFLNHNEPFLKDLLEKYAMNRGGKEKVIRD